MNSLPSLIRLSLSKRSLQPLAIASMVACFSSQGLGAKDWLHFAGPDYSGISAESEWKDWGSAEPKVAWKADVGKGAASFTIAGNRVLTTGNEGNKDVVWCFDLDSGRELWKTAFACKFDKRMFDGGTAATPTISAEFVYNLSYDGQLHCLKLSDGSIVWKVHLLEDFGGKLSEWKYAGSPLVVGDLVILDAGGSGNSTLALDRRTGKKVWGNGDANAGYASPVPIIQGGNPAVVVFKGKALVAHDLKSGKQLWSLDWETSYDVNASTPIPLGNDRLLVSSGYGGGRAVLFDISGAQPKQLWRNDDIKTKMSSCIVYKDLVFAVCGDTGGKLTCVSLKDGKTLWQEGNYGFGTLALAGDRLIVLGDKGNLVVVKPSGAGFEPVAEAQILGKTCWVKPVLTDGRLLCKNNSGKTVCLDLRK